MEKEGQRNWGGVRKVGRQRRSSTATVCNIYFCLFSLFIRLWQEKRKITFESSLRQFLVLLTIRHRWKITPNVHRRKTRGERKGKTWRLRWGTQKKKARLSRCESFTNHKSNTTVKSIVGFLGNLSSGRMHSSSLQIVEIWKRFQLNVKNSLAQKKKKKTTTGLMFTFVELCHLPHLDNPF